MGAITEDTPYSRAKHILDASGPVGIARKACEALREESDHTSNLLAIQYLGDILDALGGTEEEAPFSSDLERVLETAIVCIKKDQRIKEALLPRLPRFIRGLMNKTDCGGFAFGPAHAVLESKDPDMIRAIKPHMPELFNRTTWSSHQWGRLACAWLDAGGTPKILCSPLETLLNKPISGWDLAEEFCNHAFIGFLNHPQVRENNDFHSKLPAVKGKVFEGGCAPSVDYLLLCGVFNEHASHGPKVPLIAYQGFRQVEVKAPSPEMHLGLVFWTARTQARLLFEAIRQDSTDGNVSRLAAQAIEQLRPTASKP